MANLRVLLSAAFALALTVSALHGQQLNDPANLAGERVSPQDPADTLAINHGAAALQQLLLKLRTRASMMLIVAHPDDEDGGLLTYESRGQGARVAMLTLTRGEGGQNLMSADFDDALGLIRTQELLAADRYFGVDQFFGTEVDFGFSKTKEETLRKWTHERVLYDAVRAVRLYRPLVIASVFVGGPTDGHGHHQVAGEIAQEVFVAAADPKVFPEMIQQGLQAWAPLKVYARVPFSRVTAEGMYDYATGKTIPPLFHNYVTGKDSTAEPTATVLIHEGERSTALGMDGDTYVQFARKGLALQKTQIGGNVRLAPTGALDIGYTLKASRLGKISAREQSLFDGIDTSLPGMAILAPDAPTTLRARLESIDHQIAEAERLFDSAHLDRSAPSLREARSLSLSLESDLQNATFSPEQKQNILHELRLKTGQLTRALILAEGITETATLTGAPALLSNSSTAAIDLHVGNAGSSSMELAQMQLGVSGAQNAISGTHFGTLGPQQSRALHLTLPIHSLLPPTRPYFSRPSLQQPFYDLSDTRLRNAPSTPAPIATSVEARIRKAGVSPWLTLRLTPSVSYAEASATTQTVVIIPPVSISLSPSIGVLRPGDTAIALNAQLRTDATIPLEGTLKLDAPPGWQVIPASTPWKLSAGDRSLTVPFQLKPSAWTAGSTYTVRAVATLDHHDYTESYRPVGYPGLPYTNYYTPAIYRATAVDVKIAPGLKVAYLPGTGDDLPRYLPNLGITPAILTPKDLTVSNLKQYDAVLLGVRAYAAQPSLAGPGSKPLMDYAKQGGVVILQYMTARYGDAEAPFPIDVPGDPAHNVVEEAQPVTLLDPQSPILTWPNRITAADFDHWVAERGHGFAASWSKDYTPLLETHDPDQDAQKGGLLYARTGKGAYIYCALALYRQLPEGVPGAYRLLANLISLGKNPQLPH